MTSQIIRLIPPHVTYVEVFGGGASVLLAKGPSVVEVYNDIGTVANWFQVLRDQGPELYRRLSLTPYSRQEYEHCATHWRDEMLSGDPVEWARMWYVTILQGFTHTEVDISWLVRKEVNGGQALINHIENLPIVAQRFRRVHIENKDFASLIPLYDGPGTFFYVDPPYIHDSRKKTDAYLHEMNEERHVELLSMLQSVDGQWMISGYDNELYNDMLVGVKRIEQTRKNTIHNSNQQRSTRTEVLWIREHHHGLWDDDTWPTEGREKQASSTLSSV